MASHIPFLLSLLTLTLITASSSATTTTSAATTAFSGAGQSQMDNILSTLVAAGDFANWANILSSADPSILPVSATLFIPSDATATSAASSAGDGGAGSNLSPFLLFPYHILPQRLTFSDLRRLPTNTRLPTLLPGFSLLVTNNSGGNFTVDGVAVTRPDLFQNAALAAHAIAAPFDYTAYGNFDFRAVYGAAAPNSTAAQLPRRRKDPPEISRPPSVVVGSNVTKARISGVFLLVGVIVLVPMEMDFQWFG